MVAREKAAWPAISLPWSQVRVLDQLGGHAGDGADEGGGGGGGVTAPGGHGVAAGALDQGGHRRTPGLADHVGSDRGAVPGSLPARFPGPPSAPDERVYAHPALHGFPGQVAAGAATVLVHGVGMLLERQR